MKKVSIITPFFNAEKTLSETIESCLQQSYKSIEILLINDGSTDNSLEVCRRVWRRHPKKIKLFSQKNSGAARARNHGMKNATGQFLLFLDADDVLLPDAVQLFISKQAETHSDAVVGEWYDLLPSGKKNSQKVDVLFPDDPLANLMQKPMVGPAVLIPKTGTRWNPELIVNELFDFYFRVFLTKSNVSFIQKKVVIIRQHGSSTRITNRYDHYCPKATLPVYCSIYQKYKWYGKLTPLRKAVLEKKILFQLYKAESRNWSEWTKYADHVDRKHVKTYFWYKAFGLSGFVRSLGVIRGIKTFCFLNKLMLRAPH